MSRPAKLGKLQPAELDGQRQRRERLRDEKQGSIRPEWLAWYRAQDDEEEAAVEHEQSSNQVWRAHLVAVRCRAERDESVLRVYTDGSHEGGASGWGWVAVKGGQTIHESHGPVVLDVDDPQWVGCQFHSNNAGEISALIHAAEWMGTRPPEEPKCIIPDSWWAIGAARGATYKFHRAAARRAAAATTKARADLGWVKGHSDHPYNNDADSQANKGRLVTAAGQGQQLASARSTNQHKPRIRACA